MVSRWGLNPFRLGLFQAVEPLRFKPSVRVVDSFSSFNHASSLVAASHNLTNPFSDPFVCVFHGAGHAEFEVPKPAFQDWIDLDYDVRNAATTSTAEFLPKVIAELFYGS